MTRRTPDRRWSDARRRSGPRGWLARHLADACLVLALLLVLALSVKHAPGTGEAGSVPSNPGPAGPRSAAG